MRVRRYSWSHQMQLIHHIASLLLTPMNRSVLEIVCVPPWRLLLFLQSGGARPKQHIHTHVCVYARSGAAGLATSRGISRPWGVYYESMKRKQKI